jgi:hypothetical protein
MRRHPAGPLKEHTMTKKIFAAAIAAACAVALTAGPAQAGDGGRSTIAFSLAPDPFAAVSCPEGTLFGLGFDVDSLNGRPLGTARSCVASIAGCDPFVAFCRQTVRTTLTLDLPRGSLTVPMKLLEIWPTESSFIQVGSGKVREATGAYAAAKGNVEGGGAGAFDDQFAFTGRLVYVAALRGVR